MSNSEITQDFECTREKLTIRGTIYGDISEAKQVVILSHGFIENSRLIEPYAKMIADKGFIAVSFDFCGGGIGGKSDGKTKDMTVFTEVSDLKAVIKYIKKQPFTKSIILFGRSQGGLVSALVAKELGAKVEKLVLLYPALCIPDDARRGKMMFYRFNPAKVPDILGRLPMALGGKYAKTVMDMDPYEAIKGYEGPVLYLHGTKDDIVDISYARKGHEVYENCEYYEIEGAGHGFKGEAYEHTCELITEFLNK